MRKIKWWRGKWNVGLNRRSRAKTNRYEWRNEVFPLTLVRLAWSLPEELGRWKKEKRKRGIPHRPKGHRSIRSKKIKYPQQNRKTFSRLFLGPSGESEIFLTPTSKSLLGFRKGKVANLGYVAARNRKVPLADCPFFSFPGLGNR